MPDIDLTPLEREIRAEDVQTAGAITDVLNAHRAAILAGAASVDGVERMKREITPLLARGRELDASAGAVQSTDRTELDRYFGPDGKLNLRDWTRTAYIGGDTVDVGTILTTEQTNALIERKAILAPPPILEPAPGTERFWPQ